MGWIRGTKASGRPGRAADNPLVVHHVRDRHRGDGGMGGMNDRLLLGVYALGGRVRDEATRRRALVPPLSRHPPSAEAFRRKVFIS